MYKTSPINKNKVLSGLQNFTFDEIFNSIKQLEKFKWRNI